jgi:hypothetical protein
MGVPHGISRPRKGKARGCAQASVPHQCATARPLRCSPLSHAREERTHRAPRVGAPPTATRPRARADVRKAGGRGRLVVPHRVSSGPTCPHGPPAATTCRPPRGRCRVSSGWPCPVRTRRAVGGKPAAQTKQAGRVASSTPLASVHGTRIVLRQRDSPRGPVGRRRGRCSAKASRGRAGRGALVVWPAPRPRAHRAGRARRDGTDGEDREGRGEDGMKASSSCLHVIDGWWQWLVNQVVACTLESVAFWGRKPLGVAN